MKKKLSPRQTRIMEFIKDFMEKHQFPPTVRDIQKGCDISSTSVVDYNLHILQREGYLRRLPEVSRGIELLDGWRNNKREGVKVPILGTIAAGVPLAQPPDNAWQSDEFDSVELPEFLTKGKANVYGLRVKGESMIDAFIADGDLVLLEANVQPENGDMVAAWLNDREEATLKRFYLEGDKVRLQPENQTMEPIYVSASNLAVRGRVVGVIRSV